MILGGGDVVFPSLLAVSVIPSGFLKALIIVLFSLAGSFLVIGCLPRRKKKSQFRPCPRLLYLP